MRNEGLVTMILEEIEHHARVQYGNIVHLATCDFMTYVSTNNIKSPTVDDVTAFVLSSESYKEVIDSSFASHLARDKDFVNDVFLNSMTVKQTDCEF